MTVKYSKKIFIYVLIILSFLIISIHIIPQLYMFFKSDNFKYVNAWDEETYLTIQGAMGAIDIPGYFLSSLITLIFQNLGIAGVIQNLLFDTLLISGIIFFLYKIFIYFGIKKLYSFYYSTIVLFSSVLFNYSNEILNLLYPIREIRFIMFGHENYASILRTPEPQLSYFLTVICMYLFFKYNKKIFLFIPIPFLYFFVFIPYLYFLLIYLIYIFFKIRKITFYNIVLTSFISFLIVSLLHSFINYYFLINDENILNSGLYIISRKIVIPLVFITSFIFLSIQYLFYMKFKIEEQETFLFLQLFLSFALFNIINSHLISGYMLSYKNYFDYGLSIIIGFSIVVFIISFSSIYKIKLQLSIIYLFLIFILNYHSKALGFDWQNMQFRIYNGGELNNKNEMKKILLSSESVLIDDIDFRSKIAYSNVKMIIPPFSYQYRFPFIEKQCEYNSILFDSAFDFLEEKGYSDKFEYEYEIYKKGFSNNEYKNKNYCLKNNYINNNFAIIKINNDNIWKFFPVYK